MAITIKKNTYVQPTEIREDVVQGICEAFLAQTRRSGFHPFRDGSERPATLFITRKKGDIEYSYFSPILIDAEEGVQFHGVEMQKAFDVLRENGYYIWVIYEYEYWKTYVVTNKPYLAGAVQVSTFSDFID